MTFDPEEFKRRATTRFTPEQWAQLQRFIGAGSLPNFGGMEFETREAFLNGVEPDNLEALLGALEIFGDSVVRPEVESLAADEFVASVDAGRSCLFSPQNQNPADLVEQLLDNVFPGRIPPERDLRYDDELGPGPLNL